MNHTELLSYVLPPLVDCKLENHITYAIELQISQLICTPSAHKNSLTHHNGRTATDLHNLANTLQCTQLKNTINTSRIQGPVRTRYDHHHIRSRYIRKHVKFKNTCGIIFWVNKTNHYTSLNALHETRTIITAKITHIQQYDRSCNVKFVRKHVKYKHMCSISETNHSTQIIYIKTRMVQNHKPSNDFSVRVSAVSKRVESSH